MDFSYFYFIYVFPHRLTAKTILKRSAQDDIFTKTFQGKYLTSLLFFTVNCKRFRFSWYCYFYYIYFFLHINRLNEKDCFKKDINTTLFLWQQQQLSKYVLWITSHFRFWCIFLISVLFIYFSSHINKSTNTESCICFYLFNDLAYSIPV